MRNFCLCVLAVALIVPAVQGVAQEAEKYEGSWYQVYNVEFKMGMRDQALQHIAENFAPAGRESGTGPSMVLIHHTGDYDMTLIWELKEGPGDIAWKTSPDDVKWEKAMAEQHGEEGMAQVWKDYMDMVQDVDVIIARKWALQEAAESTEDDGDGDGGES